MLLVVFLPANKNNLFVIIRAVMFAEFMIKSLYSRARRENRRIADYVTVFATPLSNKMADQKTGL